MGGMKASRALAALKKHANPDLAKELARFFKTGTGEYGEGDVFWGLKVPTIREEAKSFYRLPLPEIETLLYSPIHEARLMSLVILSEQYRKATDASKASVVRFYKKHAAQANNWDLVDLSAPRILGAYLMDKERSALYRFAQSPNLWKRRIAVISTLTFIAQDDFHDTLRLCELLLEDRHDLIQKACGWALREVGKRNPNTLERFLNKHAEIMPRTMLRYAIEKMPEKKRRAYLLKGKARASARQRRRKSS